MRISLFVTQLIPKLLLILIILISLSCLRFAISTKNDNDADLNTKDTNENHDATKNVALPALIQLHDGNFIPRVGLGVALTADATYTSVAFALNTVGLRLFDTAADATYDNEDQVGAAIYDHYYYNDNDDDDDDARNNNVYVTTKLWDTDHGFYNTFKAFMLSYRQLNLRHLEAHNDDNKFDSDNNDNETDRRRKRTRLKNIDMYLIHSPYGGRILETYDAMLYIQQQQKAQQQKNGQQSPQAITSLGVSNFGIDHLEILRKNDRPMPTLNQIEMHPLVYKSRKQLLDYCAQHKIQIQAFGSLMHGYYPDFVDGDGSSTTPAAAFITKMVHKYNTNGIDYTVYNHDTNDSTSNDESHPQITTAHLLLQWALQHGFAIIPKSSRTERILNNVRYINLSSASTPAPSSVDFVLSDDDMALLDTWGDRVSVPERNIYKKDWNWNPIDEAPVHTGRTTYWDTNYTDIDLEKINVLWDQDGDSDLNAVPEYYREEEYDDDGFFDSYHNSREQDHNDDDEDENNEHDDWEINFYTKEEEVEHDDDDYLDEMHIELWQAR